MTKNIVGRFLLYRWRFILGYLLVALMFISLLLFAVTYTPGGLYDYEKASAVASANLDFNNLAGIFHVDLPYLLLQKASINLFGLSLISIKLPSIIISFLSAAGLVLLLQSWYKNSSSIITAAIMLLSSQYLLLSQTGTASIMAIFWSIYAMLLAYKAVVSKNNIRILYIILLGIIIALSLYTPLMLYVYLALILGSLLHPHMRFVIRKQKPKTIIFITLIAFIFTLPLLYFFYIDVDIIRSLIIGNNPIHVDWLANFKSAFNQLFDFPGIYTKAGLLTPMFSIAILLITALGIYRNYRHRYSVHSYVISIWLILALTLFIINPSHGEILFVPIALLVATGVNYILSYWYDLFPKSPYARLTGLLPLLVLVGGIVMTDSVRYFYTFSYDKEQLSIINTDLSIVSNVISKTGRPSVIVVSKSEKPFYKIYAKTNNLPLDVTTSQNALYYSKFSDKRIFATRDSSLSKEDRTPLAVYANSKQGPDSARLYLYKNYQK